MSLVRKIGLLTVGQGINVAVNLLFLPYMARALSYEEYGSYGQTLLVVSAVATLLTLGLPQILNVYLADENREKGSSLSNNLFTTFVLSIIGIIGLYFLSDWFGDIFSNKMLPELIRIYSVSMLFSIPFSSLNSYFIYVGKVKTSVYLSIFPNVIKIILVVISIQVYESLVLSLIAIVFISFIQLAISLFILRDTLIYKFKWVEMTNQLKDGLPLGLSGIVIMIILYTDSTMISYLLGVKEYSIYRNGAIEVPFISTINGAIAAIILPEVAKLWQKKDLDHLFSLKKKVIMNSIYIIYPVLFFLLFNSSSIIHLYLGDKYIESAVIFSVFNLTLLFRVNDYVDILIAAKRTRFILFSYIITFFVNIIANYVLINQFGSVGAAMSTVFSLCLLALIQLKMTLSISNKKITDLIDFKKLFIVISSSVLIAFGLFVILSMIQNQFVKLILFFTLYSTLMVIFFSYQKYYSWEVYSKLMPTRIKEFIDNRKKID